MNPDRPKVLRVIHCRVAEETYALDMAWVQGIYRVDRMRRNVGTKILTRHEILTTNQRHDPIGWVPDEGVDLAIYSLSALLARSAHSYSPFIEGGPGRQLQRVIILEPPDARQEDPRLTTWGILVDEVSQVIQTPRSSLVPLVSLVVNEEKRIFTEVIRWEDQLVLLLSPECLYAHALGIEDFTYGSAGDRAQLERSLAIESRASQPDPSRSMDGQKVRGPKGEVVLGDSGRLLIFSVPGKPELVPPLSMGLSISQVPEILERSPTTPVPGAPDYVEGLLDWRDRVVPVVDLAARLGIAVEEGKNRNGTSRMIIARDKVYDQTDPQATGNDVDRGESTRSNGRGGLIAFHIDPDVRVVKLPLEYRMWSKELTVDQHAVKGIVELEDETLLIPDLGHMLAHA